MLKKISVLFFLLKNMEVAMKDGFFEEEIVDLELNFEELQEEEVEEVRWMNLEECKRRVEDGSLKSCIRLEELYMLPEE